MSAKTYWAILLRDLRALWFVISTLLVWFFIGGRVRSAYAKALKERRLYHVDHQPGGEREP